MEKNWKTQGLDNIPEEEIRKIIKLFIARQKVELERKNRRLGIAKGIGNQSKSISLNPAGRKPNKRRGRRTSGEALHDLGILMINSGK